MNPSNPFRRRARGAAERTGEAAEAAEAGRPYLPERYFHSDTPSAVAGAAADMGPLRGPETHLGTSASQVASGSSRKPPAQPRLQSELPSVSFHPPRFRTAKTRRGAPYVIVRSNGSLGMPISIVGRTDTNEWTHGPNVRNGWKADATMLGSPKASADTDCRGVTLGCLARRASQLRPQRTIPKPR